MKSLQLPWTSVPGLTCTYTSLLKKVVPKFNWPLQPKSERNLKMTVVRWTSQDVVYQMSPLRIQVCILLDKQSSEIPRNMVLNTILQSKILFGIKRKLFLHISMGIWAKYFWQSWTKSIKTHWINLITSCVSITQRWLTDVHRICLSNCTSNCTFNYINS